MTTCTPSDVSVVVCTLNSISSIERCLESARAGGVGEIIVVDGGSTDGTVEVAQRLSDALLRDNGKGLGAARNIGIAQSTLPLILNLGSDNVLPAGQLALMIEALEVNGYAGVSAQTVIEGHDYLAQGLTAWRRGKFPVGPAQVIGTPTLFKGDLLRANPYDASRKFSDDSELCERWAKDFGARFGISSAQVLEIGKATWSEVGIRCRMYGQSDDEVMQSGIAAGWSRSRRTRALLHPLRTDLAKPLRSMSLDDQVRFMPFLMAFATLRYVGWFETARKRRALGHV